MNILSLTINERVELFLLCVAYLRISIYKLPHLKVCVCADEKIFTLYGAQSISGDVLFKHISSKIKDFKITVLNFSYISI